MMHAFSGNHLCCLESLTPRSTLALALIKCRLFVRIHFFQYLFASLSKEEESSTSPVPIPCGHLNWSGIVVTKLSMNWAFGVVSSLNHRVRSHELGFGSSMLGVL